MKKSLQKIDVYCRLFGFRHLALYAKSELLKRAIEFEMSVDRVKYPFILRLNTSDIPIYKQVFVNLAYEFEVCKPPKTIIDAGAYIGLSSIFFSNKFPEAKIVAIEPEISNFNLLEKNTAPYRNIVPIQAALWKNNKQIELIDPGFDKWGFQTREYSDDDFTKRCHKVQGITVKKLMEDFDLDHIDILKIDIEGAEKEVFENPLSWIDKVGILIVELHDRLKNGCSRSFYNATNNFELEWHKGDNVYLAREGWIDKNTLQCPAPDVLKYAAVSSVLLCRILN